MNGRQLLSSSFRESRRPPAPVKMFRLGLGEQPGNTRCHGHGFAFFACSLLIGPFLLGKQNEEYEFIGAKALQV